MRLRHQKVDNVIKKELYHTELCHSIIELCECPYGDKCQYAHSLEELRPIPKSVRHMAVRSKPHSSQSCRNFINKGCICYFGARCCFQHPSEIVTLTEKDYLELPAMILRIRTGQFLGELNPNTKPVSLPGLSSLPKFFFDNISHGHMKKTLPDYSPKKSLISNHHHYHHQISLPPYTQNNMDFLPITDHNAVYTCSSEAMMLSPSDFDGEESSFVKDATAGAGFLKAYPTEPNPSSSLVKPQAKRSKSPINSIDERKDPDNSLNILALHDQDIQPFTPA